MRQAAKVDANQAEIVEALRKAGCTVEPRLSKVGAGVPDLLVYAPNLGRDILIEVKDGSLPPSKRQLTPHQKKWHRSWGGKVFIVNDVTEALRVVGVL